MRFGIRALVVLLPFVACSGRSVRHGENGDAVGGSGAGDDGPSTGDDDSSTGDDDGSSTGDDVSVGGTSGIAGSGPSGGVSGTATSGTGGSAGPGSCAQPLDAFTTSCDAPGVMRQYCSKAGCHNAPTKAAALDLTPDDFLVMRILDAPARFLNASPFGTECVPAGCPSSALLVDSSNPGASWMLAKMAPFEPGVTTMTLGIGCGDAMPTYNTVGIGSYTDASKACLVDLFLAIAANGRPCIPENPDGGIPPPLPPCGQ